MSKVPSMSSKELCKLLKRGGQNLQDRVELTMLKIISVVSTRPNFIKIASIIRAIAKSHELRAISHELRATSHEL